MSEFIGETFTHRGKTYKVTHATPVEPELKATIAVLKRTEKELFRFTAAVVLKSGEVSKNQGGLFLRFKSGNYISYL